MKKTLCLLITLVMFFSCGTLTLYSLAEDATTITLNPDFIELWVNFGSECKIAATVTGNTPNQSLTWTSSDTAVAQVSAVGNITPVSPGTTYITAYATDGSGAVSNTVTVKVIADQTPAADQLITLGSTTVNRIDINEFLANPSTYGNAHIALWYGNATGAVTITCDDSITGDFARWNSYLATYGIPTTFFVALGSVAAKGDYWDEQLDAGQAVQSHTVYHCSSTTYGTWTSAQVWMDNYLAAQMINKHTNTESKVIAYSYGWNNGEYSSKVYIAGRGTTGTSNKAASENYNYVKSFTCGANTNFDNYIATLYDPTVKIYNTNYYGGWTSLHFHAISGANVTGDPDVGMANLYNAIAAAGEGVVWADTFANVAMYGQERDTAVLSMLETGTDRFRLSITDQMSDALFDMPLTVKIAVDNTWHSMPEANKTVWQRQ